MKLSEIASVSGKGGLFKVVSPTKSGIILESLDESKTKLIVTTHHKVSLLHEISIYTHTEEGTVPLETVLKKISQDFKNDLGVDGNSDPAELKAFLRSVLPEYDEERVYVSDIKKLVKWYGVLQQQLPGIFTSEEGTQEVEVKEEEKPQEDTAIK